MIYRELYDRIKNPFEKKGFLDEIINIYSSSNESLLEKHMGFYSKLAHTNIGDKRINLYFVQARQELKEELFNLWKDGLINKAKNTNDIELRKLVRYIYKTNPKTIAELSKNIRENNKELLPVLDKNDYRFFGTSWTYMYSNKIQSDNSCNQRVEHRLYLNCDSTVCDLIALKLIEKCREKGIGYHFKYDEDADRSDSFVIYSDTIHLPMYVDILEEIKKELPDEFEERKNGENVFHEPPLLTGVIDGWIGYGSEPSKEDPVDKDNRSFNAKRAIQLNNCMNKVTEKWLRELKDMRVSANGKTISYKEFFAKDFVDLFIENEEEKGHDKKQPEFYKNLEKEVLTNYDKIIALLNNDERLSLDIPTRDNMEKVGYLTITKILRKHSKLIADHFPEFKRDLAAAIIDSNKEMNITNNYAVDKQALALFKYYEKLARDLTEEEKQTTVSEEETIKVETKEPVIEEQKERPKALYRQKKFDYKPMTQEEILEARKRLGM